MIGMIVLFAVVAIVLWFGIVAMDNKITVKEAPWFLEDGPRSHIATYATVDLANAESNLAAAHGWSIQSVSSSEGHINLGRTVGGAVLTGGISLLLGGSRTKGAVTVTYVRGGSGLG